MTRIAQWASDQIERLRLGSPLWVGPVGEIALSLDLRWEPEGLFVIVNCYADESYDGGIFILGGQIARLGQWNGFEKEWGRLCARYNIRYFHSKEMIL